MIRSYWGSNPWYSRGYMAAGIGYPYYGGYCYPYCGWGYPAYGMALYNSPYLVM
ncbi:hypothetical protein UFOVP116_301 [uncultured Caudovirales phage]|uniref:Uncharacterized protein n=1 Tax=uncultured Caudovirales phage TaxID=2100421 RepID=A0A6J5LA43_9CAUD|nr:hypothetical protein UFOVP116_301 [uncultured Caudovirales phage]